MVAEKVRFKACRVQEMDGLIVSVCVQEGPAAGVSAAGYAGGPTAKDREDRLARLRKPLAWQG